MDKRLFTNKLQEKIHYGNYTDSKEEIQKVLKGFLNEVIKRIRNDEE